MAKRIVFALALLLAAGDTAFGQGLGWTEGRVFLGANSGTQLGAARAETQALSFDLYGEPAKVTVTRSVKSGILFDGTAGGRVLGNLGVAGTLFMRSAPGDGVAAATVPHPLFFDQARAVDAGLNKMTHTELWSAVQAAYLLRIDDRIDVMFLAGPTVVSVKHDAITAASVAEGSSNPAVTVTVTELSKMVWGYMLGADVRYMVTKNIGLGAFARYAGATANMNPALSLKLGGLQVGGGIRVQLK